MTFWKTVLAVVVGIGLMMLFYALSVHIWCYFQDGCSMRWF